MNMSVSECVYKTIVDKSLTCDEISAKSGADREYVRILLSRWRRANIVVYGEPKGTRKTYTARGAENWPTFRKGYARTADIVLGALGARPKSVVEIVAKTGLHIVTVRKALASLVRSGEAACEVGKYNKHMYSKK